MVSFYVHIPFCKQKCPYCHFYVIGDKESFKEQLLAALRLEWESLQPALSDQKIETIYFGGGTPTLFGPKRIQEVLSWMPHSPEIEITIETNPEDHIDYRAFRDIGINRISVGVQSLVSDELAILDRKASPRQSYDTIINIKHAGFDNITIDLMYDLPRQTAETWQQSLSFIKNLPITHLSLYNLTIEPDAAFFRQEKALRALMPSEETSTLMYAMAQSTLKESGFSQYEISAFCKDNLYSRHNVGYWTGRHFYGLGPSAFSFDGQRRYRNVANLFRYSKLLQEGQSTIDFEESCDAKARKKELLALNLRLLEGVDLSHYEPLEPEMAKSLDYVESLGLVERTGTRARLTSRGILFYDTVASEII